MLGSRDVRGSPVRLLKVLARMRRRQGATVVVPSTKSTRATILRLSFSQQLLPSVAVASGRSGLVIHVYKEPTEWEALTSDAHEGCCCSLAIHPHIHTSIAAVLRCHTES